MSEESRTGRVRRTSRRIREQIHEPGVRASVAADVNTVVSTGAPPAAARQQVNVRQGRSARTDPPAEEKEQG